MVIGILQFEVLVHDSRSLKDKRRVVKSIKDRLHREHMVSVAEVGALDHQRLALMGLSVVSNSASHVNVVLDRITAKLRAMTDAELGDVRRDIIHGEGGDGGEEAAGDVDSVEWTEDDSRAMLGGSGDAEAGAGGWT